LIHQTHSFQLAHPVKLILRIQPVQSYNDGAKEYDLTEKLLLQGVSQVVLPEVWKKEKNEKKKKKKKKNWYMTDRM
jgi:hypothetical protein